jgi:hypothetical protein
VAFLDPRLRGTDEEIPKVVFSNSIERADWPESRIARGDLAEEVAG